MFPQPEIIEALPSRATILAEHLETLKPANPIELGFVETVATNAWRLKIFRAREERILAAADAGSDVVNAYEANEKQLQRLAIQENRFQGMMERALRQLLRMQAKRIGAREEAFRQVKKLAYLNYVQDRAYDPTFDFPPGEGFDFSIVEINTSLRRDQRVKQGARAARSHATVNIIDPEDGSMPEIVPEQLREPLPEAA